MSLHTDFVAAIAIVRRAFGRADLGHFYVSISASGRTETGCDSVKIEYKVGESNYGSECVTGDSIDACLSEWLRRKGWSDAHAPLALTDQTHAEHDIV